MVFTTLNKRIPCIPAVFFAHSKTFQKSPCRYETLHSLNYQHFDRFPPSFFLRVARNISFEVPLSREAHAEKVFCLFRAKRGENFCFASRGPHPFFFSRVAQRKLFEVPLSREAQRNKFCLSARSAEKSFYLFARSAEKTFWVLVFLVQEDSRNTVSWTSAGA